MVRCLSPQRAVGFAEITALPSLHIVCTQRGMVSSHNLAESRENTMQGRVKSCAVTFFRVCSGVAI
jgi:hypothetical protein